ncbi:MAG: hypothetical protein OFPII_19790 [Osedax symbiont Rs1]|nr:MAG: hypothetical protein OFPII_19790 [Osedax symbiont Rs1]
MSFTSKLVHARAVRSLHQCRAHWQLLIPGIATALATLCRGLRL